MGTSFRFRVCHSDPVTDNLCVTILENGTLGFSVVAFHERVMCFNGWAIVAVPDWDQGPVMSRPLC